MPTINLSGGSGGGGEGVRRAGRSLADLMNDLLRHPSAALEHEFQARWHSIMPRSALFGGVARAGGAEIAGLARVLQQLGAKFPGGAAGAAGAAGGLGGTGGAVAAAAAQVATAAARVAASAAASAAGGGRGGGGGGFGGGGGGGRGSGGGNVVPFPGAGRGGMPHWITRLLPGPIGRPASLAMSGGAKAGIVGALLELALGPQSVAAGARLALAMGRPYAQLREGAFDVARAGGFSGEEMQGAIYPGALKTPGWMSRLGLAPPDVLQSLNRFGIVPRSAGAAVDTARSLRQLQLLPAFSGLPGTVESLAGHARGAGIGRPGLVPESFLVGVAKIMTEAIRQGMDRSSLLSSMDSSLDAISKDAAGPLNSSGLVDLFHRLQTSGAPGGRTGALQRQTVGGIAAAQNEPFGSNPPRSMMLLSALSHVTDAKSLRAALPHGVYDRIARSKTGAHALHGVVEELGKGRAGVAGFLLNEALKGDPATFMKLSRRYAEKFFPHDKNLADIAAGALSGSGYLGAIGAQLGEGSPRGAKVGTPGSSLQFMTGVEERLNIHGASAKVAHDVVAQAAKAGLDPAAFAAYLESRNTLPGTKGAPALADMAKQLRGRLEASGGDNDAAIRGEGTPEQQKVRLEKFQRAYKEFSSAEIPADVYQANAAGGQAEIFGASASFTEFTSNIHAATGALAGFIDMLKKGGAEYGRLQGHSGPQHP